MIDGIDVAAGHDPRNPPLTDEEIAAKFDVDPTDAERLAYFREAWASVPDVTLCKWPGFVCPWCVTNWEPGETVIVQSGEDVPCPACRQVSWVMGVEYDDGEVFVRLCTHQEGRE